MIDKETILEVLNKDHIYYYDKLKIIDNKLCLIHPYRYAQKQCIKYAIISDKIKYYTLEGKEIKPFVHIKDYFYNFTDNKHFLITYHYLIEQLLRKNYSLEIFDNLNIFSKQSDFYYIFNENCTANLKFKKKLKVPEYYLKLARCEYFINKIKNNEDLSIYQHLDESELDLIQHLTYYIINRLISEKDAINIVKKYTDHYYYYLYIDYLRMRHTLLELNLISESQYPKFPSNATLIKYHDKVIEKYNEIKVDISHLDPAFENVYNKQKHLEEHGEFHIILPHKAIELKEEGSKLSHCVGSYCESHACGRDIILFLRKDIEIPWITINLYYDNNQYIVRQIHGKYNSNLDKYPETQDFLNNWFKKHNIDSTNINKICAAL